MEVIYEYCKRRVQYAATVLFHKVIKALFARQGLPPFMRQYSMTEWQDGNVLFTSECGKSHYSCYTLLTGGVLPVKKQLQPD
jgi:hypothetical protein